MILAKSTAKTCPSVQTGPQMMTISLLMISAADAGEDVSIASLTKARSTPMVTTANGMALMVSTVAI